MNARHAVVTLLVAAVAVPLAGPVAGAGFADVLDEMERGLQKLGAEPGTGGDLHFEDEPF